jgi:hypothetical protein
LITSVRILASSADKPYAKPGDTVNVTVLAYDARINKPEPMNVYWFPLVCDDPADDAYFACFQQFAGGPRGAGDAGADAATGGSSGGVLGPLQPGVALPLPTGATHSFQIPVDAVTSHPKSQGTSIPYGLAIMFNIACAGHVELVPPDPSNANPQQIPIGCFDAHHHQLGPDDFVFGFTRVYAYDSTTNSNPVVDYVDMPQGLNGKRLDVHGSSPAYTTDGFSTPRCKADRRDKCPFVQIGPSVPSSSQEVNPEDLDANGNVRKEEIWVDFYSSITHGTAPNVQQNFVSFTGDARLLYDPVAGAIGDPEKTDTKFVPPDDPGDGFIWFVVHDNRGGASWVTVPVHVCDDGDPRCK